MRENPLPIKVGLGTLSRRMTVKQARRWGNRNMPKRLKDVGFQTCVFVSDPEIHGSHFIRVSYGK